MVESGAQGVLIVGCGRSGLAAARLHARDLRPLWVTDDQPGALRAAQDLGLSVWGATSLRSPSPSGVRVCLGAASR